MTESTLPHLPLPNLEQWETRAVLKQAAVAHRHLAELKGVAATIPNESILISTLTLQEARHSSEIENIITTQDDLYKAELLTDAAVNPATKEVARYRQALGVGYASVQQTRLLTTNQIASIQAVLEKDRPGYRKLPGTVLKDGAGRTVYTPPSPDRLPQLLDDLNQVTDRPDLGNQVQRDGDVELLLDLHQQVHHRQGIQIQIRRDVGVSGDRRLVPAERLEHLGDLAEGRLLNTRHVGAFQHFPPDISKFGFFFCISVKIY